jgi:putative spermidine/putrescine transport system ATP-binding protein
MTVHLRVLNLVKSYDGVRNAVNRVCLDVAKGEFISLLGPSGSGKTTLLLMIAGFEQPTEGLIELNGINVTSTPPHRRNMGMVFQGYALFPHMTVEKNIAFPLKMRRWSTSDIVGRVDTLLRMIDLVEHRNKHPRQLSGGQQQRVALARALAPNPDVLLLDEPLGALDKNLREQMQIELKRIHGETGVTMIYVTHDQSEAMAMSDRIAVFRSGSISQVAAPLEVYNTPANRFVGQFIGDSNVLPLRLDPQRPAIAYLDGVGEIVLSDVSNPGGLSEGELLLRPERLQLINGRAQSDLNIMRLKVKTVVNYGDSVLLIGLLANREVRVRLPGGHRRFAVCEEIDVGWVPSDGHLLVS